MNYIFVATKAEAQAFIDYFQPKNRKFKGYFLELTNEHTLIKSGIGLENTTKACYALEKKLHPAFHDTIYNIGIAAAPVSFTIGSLHKVKCVWYHDYSIQIAQEGVACESVDTPCKEDKTHLVDMEAFAIAKFFQKHPIHIYKVISDHFKPSTVTKEQAKALLFQRLNQIL